MIPEETVEKAAMALLDETWINPKAQYEQQVRVALEAVLPDLVAAAVRAEREWFIEQVEKYSEEVKFDGKNGMFLQVKLVPRGRHDARGMCYAEAVRRRMDIGPRLMEKKDDQ